MTLKEKLEHIWNRPGVIHACHINVWKWSDGEYWYDNKIGAMKKVISCTKGRRHGQLGPKPKGKGFSFLSRFYLLAWRARVVAPTIE